MSRWVGAKISRCRVSVEDSWGGAAAELPKNPMAIIPTAPTQIPINIALMLL
jgi:hypothetical protein